MELVVKPDYDEASNWAASYIAEKINACKDKPFVLGLPTGSSPLGIYRDLIKMYKDGNLSFKNVHTFNMDEYLKLPGDHPQSYRYFMMENFFNHIDIDHNHIHILDGMAKNPDKECKLYEEAIKKEGGIDLFLGGMGRNGHIAFNEPESSIVSRTRLVKLNIETIQANSRFFNGDIEKVPTSALTVGIGTIMEAREVLIIVSGRCKANALRAVVEDGFNSKYPLSCLNRHPKAIIVADEEAARSIGKNLGERNKDSWLINS